MDTQVYAGVTYRLPFAGLFRPLKKAERLDLVASLKDVGPLHPVLTYDSPTHGADCVIDGQHRVSLCAGNGIKGLAVVKLSVTDDTARRMAIDANAARRQLDPEELEEAKRERVKRVADLRAEGKSTRRIADEVGVSHEQVRQDIKEAGVNHLTPEPETVTGKDGKQHPAKKKPKASATSNASRNNHPSAASASSEQANTERPDTGTGEQDAPPTEPEAYFKSAEDCAGELDKAVKRLHGVRLAISGVLESPYRPSLDKAAARNGLRWAWDGEEVHQEGKYLQVAVVSRVWQCDQLAALSQFLCDAAAWLRKDARPQDVGGAPWET